ncbi:MAG: glycerol-3-phosphate 1-O-acyltransferase PlsY [Burkholderiales bacterium]|nr:glycerol-3-phosphate 1-O-acyltransferase PlsY [Burkholderiales bacterium]
MGLLIVVVAAYLIGSVSFAVVVSRAFRLPDPRKYGSGNPGATNVLRSGRKAAAALTLLGDSAKGWVAVYAAGQWMPDAMPMAMAAAAVAVIVGHMYPVFHAFRGGKGVATALGVLLALNWILALGTLATWITIVVFFRYSSLAALVSALFAVFFALILFNVAHPFFAAVTVIAVLLVWRHRSNIRNLIAGKESRLGAKAEN